MKLNAPTILYGLVLVTGIAIWLGWGIAFGVWADIGLYSISIIFILAGAAGLLLQREQARKQEGEK